MNWTELFSLLTLLAYALASVWAMAGLLGRNSRFRHWAAALTLIGFCLHTALLAQEWLIPGHASRGAYLPVLAWCLVAIAALMRWRLRQDILLLFAAPPAFALIFASLVIHSSGASMPAITGPLFYLHLCSVFTGIALMAVAAGAAVIFLWQDSTLKAKTPLIGFRKDLPALATLDWINAVATLVGFPAYSLGVLCGFAWARMAWGTVLSGDPKELMSLAIWVCYAVLFHQRQALGWRGRKPALMALALFGASLFSLLGINTFFPTHHSFSPQV